MRKIPAMVDMRRTPEEWKASGSCMPMDGNEPAYFYGLSISLENPELEKLALDTEDVQPGDMIHIHAMAVVTSVRKDDTEANGPSCRVELTLRNIASEDEDEENEQDDGPTRRRKLYGA